MVEGEDAAALSAGEEDAAPAAAAAAAAAAPFWREDGDDVADTREILMSGWGTFDTHAGPSNLQYGFDNWIWGTVGYSGFEGVVGPDTLKFGQGIYR